MLDIKEETITFAISNHQIGNRQMKRIGDKVLISPDLTHLPDWIKGRVIEVENNTFVGIVISAETEDGNVFFGKEDLFKPLIEEVCLP